MLSCRRRTTIRSRTTSLPDSSSTERYGALVAWLGGGGAPGGGQEGEGERARDALLAEGPPALELVRVGFRTGCDCRRGPCRMGSDCLPGVGDMLSPTQMAEVVVSIRIPS